MLLFACAHGAHTAEMHTTSQAPQKITPLTAADQKRLRDQRVVVEKILVDEDSRQNCQTTTGKLGTIRALLQNNTFKPNQTYELLELFSAMPCYKT